MLEEFEYFLKSHKYVFKNEQIEAEKGMELNKKLVSENAYYEVHQDAKNFLGTTFFSSVLNEDRRQGFILYV